VIGKLVTEVIPEPSLSLVREKYKEAMETKQRVTWEEVTPFPTGTKIGIVTLTPIMDAAGNGVQLVGSVHDVTDERNAGEILKQSEEKYKQVFKYSPLPKWILDYNSLQVLDVNESACLVYGYNREEFLRLTLMDITDNEYVPKIRESLQRERNTLGVVKYGICVHVKKDGSGFQTEVSASRFSYLEKDALLVVSNDVMERENALLQLKSNEAKLLTAQKIAKLGYWQLLPGGTDLYWSDEVYSIWGVERSQFILNFDNFFRTIPVEEHEAFMKAQALAVTGARELNFEHRVIMPDGSMKWVHEIGNLRKDEMGRPVVFEGTVQDITQQKNGQLALEERNIFIETALENLPIGIAVNKISTGQVTLINNKFTEIYGWPATVLTDLTNFFTSVYPDDQYRAEITARILADMASGDVNRMAWEEISITTQAGLKRTVNAKNIPLYDQDLMISTVVDVTEKVIAERDIKLANERFNYVNLATRDAIYDWDVVHDIFSWGESFKRIFGHNPSNGIFTLREWSQLMHPEDSQDTQELWDKFLADKYAVKWTHEFRFKNSEGDYLFVEEIGYLIRDAEGNPVRMIGVLRDQTQRKKEEQQLKLLESVITNSDNAVMITEAEPFDEPGPRIVFVNEAFTKMTGYNLDELRGRSPRILQGAKSDKTELAKLSKAMRSWQPYESTVINYKKSGEEFWINFTVSPIMDDRGWYTHWIAIERDVTAQKNLEEQKKLLAEISSLFNQALNLGETLVKVLSRIREVGDYALGEVWLLDTDAEKLVLAAKLEDEPLLKTFYQKTSDVASAQKGVGLAGLVWATNSIQYWNVNEESMRLRDRASREAGLLKIYGIPLFYNNNFIGTMMLGSVVDFEIQNDFIALSENFGAHIGAEIKRKQLEEELNQIFTLAKDIICIEDKEGYFKKINPAACEFLEYSEAELLNTPYVHFIHPDDVQTSINAVNSLFEGEEKVLFENRYRTKSGKIKWIEWTATMAPENNLIFSVGRDITESKNLSSLLEKSNRMAAIGSWEIDVINNTVFWSDITKEIREAGPDFKPDLETGIRFFREGKDQDMINQRVNQCKIDGTPWDEELQIVTFKGNLKWIRTIGEAEFVNGKCIRIYGSFQDIDANKTAELEALRNLEEKNTILESIGDAFFAVDQNWIVTYWNAQAEKMFGFERHMVVSHSLWEIFTTHESSPFYLEYHRAMAERKVLRFEAALADPGLWVEVSVYPTLNGLSVYLKDSTLEKESEERVRVSEEKNKLIMSAALDAIVCINRQGEVTFWNPHAETIFGWSEEDMMGKKLSEYIVPPQYRKMHDDGLTNYLITGRGEVFNKILDLTAVRKNGETFPIELAVIPIKQESDEFFCAFIRDISARKLVEVQLKELNQNLIRQTKELAISNQELEQFAYVASHDLQEPLRMVTSFIKQLEKKYSDVIDDKGKQYIHFAVDGAVRMRQIILDLLEFSRAGRWDEKIEKVDLREVLDDILVLFTKQIEETGAEIYIDPLPIIHASKSPIRQVLQNLLSNAIKYKKEGVAPSIRISSREDETSREIIVSDNGIGIEAEFYEKIFIIFQRLHNKDEYSGTGIGLAIVKKIVENMGGKIRLESEKDRGSTFYITLPKLDLLHNG
jgi:PAS domain S-box-containing protein